MKIMGDVKLDFLELGLEIFNETQRKEIIDKYAGTVATYKAQQRSQRDRS